MQNRVLILGDLGMATDKINRIFLDAWNITPICITQEMDSVREYLKVNKASVLFLRIDVTGNNGLEVTRSVKRNMQETKIVWMASKESYALSGFEEGVDAFLSLPLSEEKLEGVGKILERRS